MPKVYIGPDPLFIRTIAAPFADDPDWLDPGVAEPDAEVWSTPNVRRGTMAPLKGLAISFAFVDATQTQIRGGTCDAYTFVLKDPENFGLKPGANMLRERTGVASGHDCDEPLVVDVSKYAKMGVRLSNVTAPGGATELRICIQEIDPV